MAYKYKQGIYEIQNWDKYAGTENPRYLSSLELRFFHIADHNPRILEWGSENVVVKYFSPTKNRVARYLVDLYIKYAAPDGTMIKEIIEIKPYAQTQKPVRGNKKQKTYDQQVLTWMTNTAKWQEAIAHAEKHGMTFRIITEKCLS